MPKGEDDSQTIQGLPEVNNNKEKLKDCLIYSATY
jgi:hypothetical protein